MATVTRVTRVVCRIFAGEFNDEGRLVNETPVMIGGRELTPNLYYPFDEPLMNLIGEIDDSLWAERLCRDGDRAQGGESELPGGIRQFPREAGEAQGPLETSDGEKGCGEEDGGPTTRDGGRSQESVDQGRDECREQPASCEQEEESEQGEQIKVVEAFSAEECCSAAWMIKSSCETEGAIVQWNDCYKFISEIAKDPESVCLLATIGCNQVTAGCLVIRRIHNDVQPLYEVNHLFVKKGMRGANGIALKLLRGGLAWARDEEAAVMISTSGDPRPYYRFLGFEPTHRLCVTQLSEIRRRLRGA
jgi:hypothetical protein